jgi:hypothetical protein
MAFLGAANRAGARYYFALFCSRENIVRARCFLLNSFLGGPLGSFQHSVASFRLVPNFSLLSRRTLVLLFYQ